MHVSELSQLKVSEAVSALRSVHYKYSRRIRATRSPTLSNGLALFVVT